MRSFVATDRSGSVVSDTGVVLEFGRDAFEKSGLRLLRPGQRVAVTLEADGSVGLVTLVGFPTP